MLAYEVTEYYNFTLQKSDELMETMTSALNFIRGYITYLGKVIPAVANSTTGTNSGGTKTYNTKEAQDYKQQLESMLVTLRTSFNIIDPIIKLTQIRDEIKAKYGDLTEDVNVFLENVDSFLKLYQSYIQKTNYENAILFIQKLLEVDSGYTYIKQIYKTTIWLLNDNAEYEHTEPEKVFELQLLDVKFSYSDFTKQLLIINKVYTAIGDMFYPDKRYEDLKIIKIESGSLLTKVLGEKNIIDAVSLFLHKAIELGFNKYSLEGRLLRHSEFVDAIRKDIDVCKQFEDLGCDMSEASEALSQSFTMATKGIMQLSQSSPDIVLNGKLYKYSNTNQQKYLEAIQNPKLPDSIENYELDEDEMLEEDEGPTLLE